MINKSIGIQIASLVEQVEAFSNLVDMPRLHQEYEIWYTQALKLVTEFLPERLSEFKSAYLHISNYLLGHPSVPGVTSRIIFTTSLYQQKGIILSIRERNQDNLDQLDVQVERQEKVARRIGRGGTTIFIGHGQSLLWKDLKDFIQDRLRLPWDEFNRIPVAGVTNTARLSEMLDNAVIAFLVMTAEDEQVDGTARARMNVIHEAGLFQGRLGFTKAIILLEEGCEEFGNIQGLGQIRFPKGNIEPAFEEIRRVLEREHIIDS